MMVMPELLVHASHRHEGPCVGHRRTASAGGEFSRLLGHEPHLGDENAQLPLPRVLRVHLVRPRLAPTVGGKQL